MKIAVIGAGWAGLAAAVEATLAGHEVVVFEASRTLGGRARAFSGILPDGTPVTLDNGQHILIGAYTQTLRLLHLVDVPVQAALLRRPLTLIFPDARGLRFPAWPTPLDALAAILTARGWRLADKWSLLRAASNWQRQGFQCDATLTVAQLGQDLSPRVMTELIEPLCVSALNTAAERASAQVFLRVMQDALFGIQGGSNLLLPRLDLSALFPQAAARWLSHRGTELRLATRVDALQAQGSGWQLQGELFDHVIVATSATAAVRLLQHNASTAAAANAETIRHWSRIANALQFEAITTVYAWSRGAALPHPMLTLRSHSGHGTPDTTAAPAQFVFDRGQLGGPQGLLAFVISASQGERQALQAQVLTQAQQQLGLNLQAVQTVVEKRATFACTPALQRPAQRIAPGLSVCGDYVAGSYPATLEGALRSATAAVQALRDSAGNEPPATLP